MGTHSPTNRLRQPPTHPNRLRQEYEVEYIHSNQTHYQKPQYYVKWKGYPLEEKAVQLYLNKNNQTGGPLGEEGDGVRIENSSSLETWAQEQGLNPEPGFLWAAGPVDRRNTHPHFSEIEPLQADTERIDPCGKKRQTKEIIAPNGGFITVPNGGTDLATISVINLKST
ncbi:hypothetical protein DSO57_1011973 [Entomophthora muscae]|uniref:Uncharacterized protein n=1 Tax=Entomophthora muscae TaxID=34485 RepID=A0ACC2SV51_9FUNG|nr:hypothetical protein DSO57_1011973 [Entomophthora muscae]